MSSAVVVTKSSNALVRPSEPTPSGKLPLSPFDNATGSMMLEILYVYKIGQKAAKTIREALSRALVPYYSLAGRLIETEDDGLQIACTAEGVWFVEASANCTLSDVGQLEDWSLSSKDQYLPFSRPEIDPVGSLLMLQVTEFTCGGFAIGLIFNHVICDAVGVGQFLRAVGEIARGCGVVDPVWCRDQLPINPATSIPRKLTPPVAIPATQSTSNPNSIPKELSLEYYTFDISLSYINNLKKKYNEKMGKQCTVFDVVVAKLWQSRVRAIRSDTQDDIHLLFPINVRHILSQFMPGGGDKYYGNCAFPMYVMAPASKIGGAPLVEIIELIQKAKERLFDEFWRWAKGGSGDWNLGLLANYNFLVVTDLSRAGLSEVDYGWGTPIHGGNATLSEFVASCVILKAPKPEFFGARLVTRCVRKEHMRAFLDQIMEAAVILMLPKHASSL